MDVASLPTAYEASGQVSGMQMYTRGNLICKQSHQLLEKPAWSLNDCLSVSAAVVSSVADGNFRTPAESRLEEWFVQILMSKGKAMLHMVPTSGIIVAEECWT